MKNVQGKTQPLDWASPQYSNRGLAVVMVTTMVVVVGSLGRYNSTSQHDERNDGKQNPLNLH
jgi:hypothetical protein